jgi:AraC-like DNA-binding protein
LDLPRNNYQAREHECPYSDLVMSVTGKALWYIESHLDADVSLEAAADSVGVSRFHLSRAFTASTGKALTGYARARRLSVAARKLLNGASDILTVALEAGYGSHEAFTRAFRQHFALTPEQFRTRGGEAASLLREPMQMNPPMTASTLTPPRIVTSEAKLIFGLGKPCAAAGDPGIPGLWSRFTPYIGSIANQIGTMLTASFTTLMTRAATTIFAASKCGRFLPSQASSLACAFRRRHMPFLNIAITCRPLQEHGERSGSTDSRTLH